jgi:ribosomal protein L34E
VSAAAEVATCRNCEKTLEGKPYYMGGVAYLPKGRRAPVNYYGGYVCSRRCDHAASLALEQSMPGHGYGQQKLGQEAQRSLENNWPDE